MATKLLSLKQDNAGVTLIELMVVLVIFAIGFLALMAVQTASSSDVTATGLQTRALSVGQAQMEQVRSAGFAAAQADSGITGPFTWITDVESAGIGLNQVTVTVSWNVRGIDRSLELTNLLSLR